MIVYDIQLQYLTEKDVWKCVIKDQNISLARFGKMPAEAILLALSYWFPELREGFKLKIGGK